MNDALNDACRIRNHYASISVMKGIAILMVAIVHSTIYFQDLNVVIFQLTRAGRWGCQAFFVISGFTLSASWKRNKLTVYEYIKRRFLKIAAYWYIAILFFQSYYILAENFAITPFTHITNKPFDVLLSVLMLNGISPTGFNSIVPGGWYIGTQWIFYLLFPVCVKIYDKFEQKQWNSNFLPLLALLVSFLVQVFVAIRYGDASLSALGTFLYYSWINQLPCFLCGMSLYYNYCDDKYRVASWKNYIVKFVLFGGGATGAFYLLRNVSFIFVFVPVGYAIMFCYLFLILEQLLLKWHSSGQKYVVSFFIKWSKISYEAYYTNTIFEMLIPFHLMNLFSGTIKLDGTFAYFVALPLMIVATYVSAQMAHHIHLKLHKR